ncbi:hypothetical protein MJN85_32450, partial [Salmonella enterica subsp. enterica serovar Anatum]|nr:hypothetical protein [Salmonella enterica subsp. enterica serovar Anatum]
LIYFANDIYHLVAAPLIKQMPQGATMIATDVASPFFTPIKLTCERLIMKTIKYAVAAIALSTLSFGAFAAEPVSASQTQNLHK